MIGRGEHSEITTFVGQAVESELSGNMIDVCPVGALTSKPFRYHARTWELARRRSVSPHDSVGSNLVIQVKDDQVMRVVPFENEEINECWISDRDRFSYEGLNSVDRLQMPMIKGRDGQWRESSWADALQAVVQGLETVKQESGATQIGAVAAEYSTLEELSLLSRVVRGLGSDNIDFRLRQTDAAFDSALTGVPWLGMPIADLGARDRVLVVGSFLRKDHPLFAQRLRQAAKQGAQVSTIDVAGDDALIKLAARALVRPDAIANTLAEVAVALSGLKAVAVPDALSGVKPSEQALAIAQSLASGETTAVLLGSVAVNSPQASLIAANAQLVAQLSGGTLGFLTAGANTVGGYLAGAIPKQSGKTAAAMFDEPLKAYVVMHAEPSLDADNGQQALAALHAAQFVVALTPFASAAREWAHVMLPIAPFTETSGTYVNAQGTAQSFKGTVAPLGQTRPGWKVLRVLGNLLKLSGFDEESSESVRDAVLSGGVEARLSNQIDAKIGVSASGAGLQRVADLPIFRSDAMVRRATALQLSAASQAPVARLHPDTVTALSLDVSSMVRVKSATGQIMIAAQTDRKVTPGTIRLSAGFDETMALGGAFTEISVERA